MNCSNCGSYIADGWRFCKGCGLPADPARPPQQAETIPLRGGAPSPGTEPTLVLHDPVGAEPTLVMHDAPWNEEATAAPDTVPDARAETPPAPTVWSPPQAAPVTNPNAWSAPAPTPVPATTPAPRKSSAWVLPVLIGVGLVLLGGGVMAALVLTRVIGPNSSGVNAGTQPTPVQTGNVNGSPGSEVPSTPIPSVDPNINTGPTPTPPDDSTAVRGQVMSTLNAWADSIRRRSLADNMSLYADQLDVYYGSSNVSNASVRSNRAQIFSRFYDSTDVQLSNVDIVVSPDGNHAEVTYDNTYDWRGGARTLSGKSHNKMILDRRGSWLITSEIHLSQYYENRGDSR